MLVWAGKPNEELSELLRKGKISREAVCIAAKISDQELTKYLDGDVLGVRPDDAGYLTHLTAMLNTGISAVPDDERVRSMLEGLVRDYKLNAKMLSLLLDVEKPDIEKMLRGESIDLTVKYHLAVRASYVFHALRKTEYQKG